MNLHGQVETLNSHIGDFNEFIHEYDYNEEFHPIHFVGSLESHQAEEALIDHWDEFLQFSQNALNADGMPREEALGHIDTINLKYKRAMEAAQQPRA